MENFGNIDALEQRRAELNRKLSQIREEEKKESTNYSPTSAILIGGGGHMVKRYGSLFEQAGLPVSAIIDLKPQEETLSNASLPDIKYLQITDVSPLEKQVEKALDEFPQAAVFITTPQGTHIEILDHISSLLYDRKSPIRIEKPLATSLSELDVFLALTTDPAKKDFVKQMVAGGYTLDKATPELITLGVFPTTESVLRHIKPINSTSPDFLTTYTDPSVNMKRFGKLKHIGFYFHEGRSDIRDVVGRKFGERTYLAVYPGGGMISDLTDHISDKLATLKFLTPDSRFFTTYIGYVPMGAAEASFPWPVPQNEGLAEFEVATTLKTGDIPVVLSWGKRGPEFLGDKRKSTLYFENATVSTDYSTNERGQANISSVTTSDDQKHSYYLDVNPWILMLERFKGVWNNSLPGGIRGIYPQVLSTIFQEDILNIWKHNPTAFFQIDPRHRIRDQGIEKRHMSRMKLDEEVVRGLLTKLNKSIP